MSRKDSNFNQALHYLSAGAPAGQQPILHNLQARKDDLAAIQREFEENVRLCPHPPRKNGVIFYHEILSFSVHDKAHVTPEILEELGQEYLRLRAPEALAYAKPHFETGAVHLHLIISANLPGSSKKLRLSRSEFNQVKQEIESIQKERYPELRHSLAQQGKARETVKRGRGERERARRTRKTEQGRTEPVANKDRVFEKAKACLLMSESEKEFVRQLEGLGLEYYCRGRTPGVIDKESNRNFRLKTLGLSQELETARERWRLMPERLRELERIELEKTKLEFLELERIFRREIMEAFKRFDGTGLAPEQERRQDQLRQIRQREWSREKESIERRLKR